jgi:hypothetical protein
MLLPVREPVGEGVAKDEPPWELDELGWGLPVVLGLEGSADEEGEEEDEDAAGGVLLLAGPAEEEEEEAPEPTWEQNCFVAGRTWSGFGMLGLIP